MSNRTDKNPYAVALGKMGKGKPKTGLTDAERARRSALAIANAKKIAERRAALRAIRSMRWLGRPV